MGEAFALQALAHPGLNQQIDRALFQQSGAHAFLDIFSAARFDDDGFNALQVEKMSKD